jgi:hypothetical protein
MLYCTPLTNPLKVIVPCVPPQVVGLLPTAVVKLGRSFTTTFTVPAGELHPATVATTLYVPLIDTVAPVLIGFCNVELNEPGPLHVYVAPLTVEANNLIVSPEHTGLLLVAVGALGGFGSLKVTSAGELVDEQPVETTVTTKFPYVPAFNPLIITCPLPFAVWVIAV